MIIKDVIPAYPYEGALYWLFSESRSNHKGASAYDGAHPYYLSLYGPDHAKLKSRAAALCSLFDVIIVAPADAYLPDWQQYSSGKEYEHPDLRISMSWKFGEWDLENREIANLVIEDERITRILNKRPEFHDENARRHFLCRILLQMRIANEEKAILLGDEFFNLVYHRVAELVSQKISDTVDFTSNVETWNLDQEMLNLVGLDFAPANIDTFATIRQTKEITEYGKDFRSAIENSIGKTDPSEQLFSIMKKAMQKENVSRYVAGGFETAGSATNFGGLIPFLGTITSAAGIGSDASARLARHIENKNQWYLIGPKMREVALKEFISRRSHNDE